VCMDKSPLKEFFRVLIYLLLSFAILCLENIQRVSSVYVMCVYLCVVAENVCVCYFAVVKYVRMFVVIVASVKL
jgi:hypothetical protein